MFLLFQQMLQQSFDARRAITQCCACLRLFSADAGRVSPLTWPTTIGSNSHSGRSVPGSQQFTGPLITVQYSSPPPPFMPNLIYDCENALIYCSCRGCCCCCYFSMSSSMCFDLACSSERLSLGQKNKWKATAAAAVQDDDDDDDDDAVCCVFTLWIDQN